MHSEHPARRPDGRRVWRVVGWIGLAGVVIFLLAAVLLRQPIGRFVLGRTLVALGRALRGRVTVERVEGDVFSDLRLVNVTAVAGSDSTKAETLAVKYDFPALLTGRIVLKEVEVTSPVLFVSTERTPATPESAERAFPRMTIKRLAVTGGRLLLGGRLRVDSLALALELESNRPEMRLQLDSARWRMVEERLAVRNLAGTGRLTRDSLVVDRMAAVTSRSRLSGSLRIALQDNGIAAELDSLRLDLDELFGVPGQVCLKGKATQQNSTRRADVRSTADGLCWRGILFPRLTGRVELVDTIVSVTLSGASEDLGVLDFHGDLALGSLSARGGFETRGLAVSRLEPQLPEFRLDARCEFGGVLASLRPGSGRDSLNVTVEGRIAELGVDTLRAEAGYRAGTLQLHNLVTSGRAGRLSFVGLVKRGTVLADCRLESLDMAAVGRFAGVFLAGRLSGQLHAESRQDTWGLAGLLVGSDLDAPGFKARAALAEVGLRVSVNTARTPAVEFAGRLAVGGEGVSMSGIDFEAAQFVYTGPEFSLRLDRTQDRMVALGSLRFEEAGLVAEVETLEYATAAETLAARRFTVALDAESTVVRGVYVLLADGSVTGDVTLRRGMAPELRVAGKGINLRKLQRLMRSDTEMWGTLDFDLGGAETLRLDATVADFEVAAARVRLKRIEAQVDFGRNGALVRRLGIVHRVDTTVVSGSVAYTLKPRFELGPLELRVDLADPGPWLFELTRPYVEVREAQVYGSAVVRGNWRALQFDGRARVSRAELYVPSIDATVDRAQAEITLTGDQIRIEKLSGRSTRGLVTLTGIYDMAPGLLVDSLHFLVRFGGAAARPMPDVYAIGGGEITVSWRPGEQTLIAGRIDVEEALVAMSFGGDGHAASSSGEEPVALDLDIRGERGIWLRNRDADIEMAVDLRVRQSRAGAVYAGRLTTRHGSVYYLDHTLRVTDGVMNFENIDRFNPEMNIAAELPVRGRNGNGPDKIVLRLTGTLEHPVFDFASEPAVWDAGQIVSYMSLNVTADELTAMEQKDAVTRLVTQRLLGYFQTRVTRQVRDYVALDYLEVETGLAGGGASVTVGKYIGRNLYVAYSQNFSTQLQPAFTVQYYLNRRSELLAERSADGRYSLRYQFRLRY